MPATRFFAMLRAGMKLDWERRNWLLAELCDVAPCALGDAKYHAQLKAIYVARAVGKPLAQIKTAISGRPAMDSNDPKTGATLAALFNAVTG